MFADMNVSVLTSYGLHQCRSDDVTIEHTSEENNTVGKKITARRVASHEDADGLLRSPECPISAIEPVRLVAKHVRFHRTVLNTKMSVSLQTRGPPTRCTTAAPVRCKGRTCRACPRRPSKLASPCVLQATVWAGTREGTSDNRQPCRASSVRFATTHITHTHAHTRAHIHTHARTHTYMHTQLASSTVEETDGRAQLSGRGCASIRVPEAGEALLRLPN